MLKVLVCDDDEKIRREIVRQIKNQILIWQYDWEIAVECASPVVLLEELSRLEEKRNIYFLDVDLRHPEYDGFSLGKRIRDVDPNGTIVYITSYRDLAYKTFQYHIEAFDYIVKDDIAKIGESLAHCMKSIEERIKSEKSDPIQCYTFRTGDIVRHIPIDDIYFFETSKKSHYVILHGKQERIEFLANLGDIEEELRDHFLKIHRSYLVAVDKIEEIDLKRNLVCVGGEYCAVSRKEKSNLLRRINA